MHLYCLVLVNNKRETQSDTWKLCSEDYVLVKEKFKADYIVWGIICIVLFVGFEYGGADIFTLYVKIQDGVLEDYLRISWYNSI